MEGRKLHNEELNDLYSSPTIIQDQIEKIEMGGARSVYWERRDAYRVLVWKPERKRPLRRPLHRWGDSIKVDLQEVE